MTTETMFFHPAQTLEQSLVSQFFESRRGGYFVEVGANEPRLRSQTWHLEQDFGWTGVLIEPQPDLASVLRLARRAKVFEAACSSRENAGQNMALHLAGPMSSLNREDMAPGTRPTTTINVPVRTLDDILAEAGAPAGFDLLSVDVEGHEIEALSGFTINYWKPKLILLEDHVPDLKRHQYMRSIGYKIIRRFDSNGWYVSTQSDHSPSFRETIEIVRKYYLALPFRKARNVARRAKRGFGTGR